MGTDSHTTMINGLGVAGWGVGGIEALAAMHPADPLSPEQMRKLKQQGFRGFKFHPDYQDFFVDDPRMYPLYERIAAEGMFVLFHAGVDRGLPHPVHATPKRLAAAHRAVPGLSIATRPRWSRA